VGAGGGSAGGLGGGGGGGAFVFDNYPVREGDSLQLQLAAGNISRQAFITYVKVAREDGVFFLAIAGRPAVGNTGGLGGNGLVQNSDTVPLQVVYRSSLGGDGGSGECQAGRG
jgi:hypothetical protein